MTIIDLDSLVNPSRLPRVKLFGREIVVHPLSGTSAHRVASVYGTKDESGALLLEALLEVVRSSCPDLTEDEVRRLSLEQLTAVVQLSRNSVEEVEAMIAKAAEKN